MITQQFENLYSSDKKRDSVLERKQRLSSELKALINSFSGKGEDLDIFLEQAGPLIDELESLTKQEKEDKQKEKEKEKEVQKQQEMEAVGNALSQAEASLAKTEQYFLGQVESKDRIERRIQHLSEEKKVLNDESTTSWRDKSWEQIIEAKEDAATKQGKLKFTKDWQEAWCNLKDLEGSELDAYEKELNKAEQYLQIEEKKYQVVQESLETLTIGEKDQAVDKIREINRWKRRVYNLKLAINKKRVEK